MTFYNRRGLYPCSSLVLRQSPCRPKRELASIRAVNGSIYRTNHCVQDTYRRWYIYIDVDSNCGDADDQ
jgi:hypothetical protein